MTHVHVKYDIEFSDVWAAAQKRDTVLIRSPNFYEEKELKRAVVRRKEDMEQTNTSLYRCMIRL